jgi:hypothetical protein
LAVVGRSFLPVIINQQSEIKNQQSKGAYQRDLRRQLINLLAQVIVILVIAKVILSIL